MKLRTPQLSLLYFVLSGIIDAAFQSFTNAEHPIVHKTLSNGMLMLEMYHGKSLAFKDLSMSCAARILEYFLEKSDSTVTLLIGIFDSNMRFSGTQRQYN